MTTLTKVLIGAAAVTTVAVVTTVIKKNEQKNNDIAEQAVRQDEKGSIIKRIKRFVTKKVIRILGWVAIHMEQIEAAATIIGFVGTIISITGAIRDFVRSNDLNDKLDEVNAKIDSLAEYSKDEFKALYEDHNILAHNQAKIAKAVGVPVKEEIV